MLPGLAPDVAGDLGLPPGTPVVIGASDGPLANLGPVAVHPGQVACSIGTSGALRVMVERAAVDPARGVFCYAFLPGRWCVGYAFLSGRWCVGGAINNGGSVLAWAEGSSFGAALLGMQALGLIGSLDLAADLVRIDSTVRPRPDAVEVFRPAAAHLREPLRRPEPGVRGVHRLGPLLAPPCRWGG
ncbi:MAG: hypothetical protein ACXV3S_10535 [Kineosporiaceae bacterium]